MKLRKYTILYLKVFFIIILLGIFVPKLINILIDKLIFYRGNIPSGNSVFVMYSMDEKFSILEYVLRILN